MLQTNKRRQEVVENTTFTYYYQKIGEAEQRQNTIKQFNIKTFKRTLYWTPDLLKIKLNTQKSTDRSNTATATAGNL